MTGPERPCPDDLLARARSGGLSELERRALAAHLTNCGACTTSVVVAARFREAADDTPADASMVARVARRAGARHAASRGALRWRGRAVAAATAALLLVAGGAFAWVGRQGGSGLRSVFHRSPDPKAPTRASRDLTPREPPPSVEPRPLPQAAGAVADPPVAHLKRRLATARIAIPSLAEQVSSPSAVTMFARANSTRRRGDLQGAVSLYRALRRQFPETSEARLSAISLGDVLLDLGAPGRALDAYDAYLAENAAGSLREEALFARTRCLHTLDRGTAELDTWRALLTEFPRSAYAPLAQRRIAELQR